MTATILRLRKYIEGPKQDPHVYKAGRAVNHEIPDFISDGFVLLMQDTDLCVVADGGRKVGI